MSKTLLGLFIASGAWLKIPRTWSQRRWPGVGGVAGAVGGGAGG